MRTFHVTQEDIDNSEPLNGVTDCPVAKAIKRGGYQTVEVRDAVITIHPVDVATPIRVGRFIRKFDAGKPVSPISFRLPIPA